MGVRGDEIYRIKEEERKGVGCLGRQVPLSSIGLPGKASLGGGREPEAPVYCGFHTPLPVPVHLPGCGSRKTNRGSQCPFTPWVLGLCLLILHHNSNWSRSLWTPQGSPTHSRVGAISMPCLSWRFPGAQPCHLLGFWSWGLPRAFILVLPIQPPSQDTLSGAGREPLPASLLISLPPERLLPETSHAQRW